MIGGLCGYLAVGKVPDPITDVKGAGQKKLGPTERHHIKVAATYISAARSGQISDGMPVKTVMRAFGVGRRTAEVWAKHSTTLQVETPEILTGLLKRAGRRYQQSGRSQAAITKRTNPAAKSEENAPTIGRPIGLSYEEYLTTIKYDELPRDERIADIESAFEKLGE
jgi:hypothetical protein